MSNIRPDLSTADFNAAMTAATQHARGEAEIPVESVPASVNQAIADADSKAVTAGGVAAVASQTARVPDVFNAPVVFVGDSITAGSSGCSRIWGYLQGCGGTLRALEGYNKGVGGDTINMILSRMADIKAAITEGAVVDMQVGTNDITLETGTPEEFKARVVTACREFLKAGAALVVLHPIPAPTARPEGNAVQLPEWLVARTALNEQLASIELAGVIYETDSASVNMSADDYSDGTHLTLEGALKLGLAQSAWCRRGQRSLMDNLTPGNLLTNPTMSGTGGSLAGAQSPTGDVPDNWTLASPHFAGVVGSKTQDAINTGEEAFTVTIPDAASNGSVVAVRTTVNLPEGTKAGERYVGIIEWRVEAGHTQFRNIDLQAFSQGTRTIEFARSFAPTPGSVEMSGLLTTAFGSEIAAGQTSTTFEVTLRFATGTASGVFHFGKAKFFKVQDSVQAVSDKSAALLAGDESYLPASVLSSIPSNLGASSDLSFTVGGGGDYETINDALQAIQPGGKAYRSGNFKIFLELLSGFVMEEQVVADGVDLSGFTITAQDATTVISRASLVAVNVPHLDYDSKPAFLAVNGGKLPIISALFSMDTSGASDPTAQHGVMVAWGGFVHVDRGCGVINATGRGLYGVMGIAYARGSVWDGAGTYGVRPGNNSVFNIREGSAVGCGQRSVYVAGASSVAMQDFDGSGVLSTSGNDAALVVQNGAVVLASGCDFSGSATHAVLALSASTIDLSGANLSGAANRGINAIASGKVTAVGADITSAGDRAVNAVQGSEVNCQDVDATGFGGSVAFAVFTGSIINASNATGTTSQSVNTVSANGIIFGAA